MARNHPIKILWYGSETDDEGNPIIPKISPSFEKRLEGLNEGEIYIHNDDNNPSIYIRTNKDRVVAISGGANIEELSKYFLRKDKEDTANGLITFLKGLLIGKNGSGITVLENGMSQAVVDYLYVKVKAVFDELEVKKKTYVGGEQVISHAGMKCNRVDELDDVYRCYFKEEEDGIEIENQFTPGSLAIAQECNIKTGVSHHVGNRYYWRLVTAVGENYIDLSKTVCDPNVENDVPVAGDDIVGLGHKTDITRQAAIILSSVNEVSPSIIMYQGINDFTLTGKDVISFDFDKSTGKARMKVYGDAYIGDKDRTTYMEYTQDKGVDIKGMFHIEQGSTGWRNMEGLPDEIQAAADLAQEAKDAIDNAAVGSVNLLRNSGFTGDYETEDLFAATELSADTELFSKQLEYWTGLPTVSADSDAGSGYSAAIGSLSQSVSLIKGESYVISYKAKGTSVSVSCGSFSVSQPLTSSYQRYTHKITFNGSGIFLISGTATVCDLQLERGTIATDWKPSILDNDKATAGFQSINYIASAIKDGSVDILGGLILANMIQLGNYKNGKLQKVTAGVSGIYNDDDDVAFWAGGKLEQAILTVMRFRNDPNYQPTDAEWANMANFVATHGGDVFLRGYIYALGGYFRGKVEIANGKILLNEDGSGQLANGNIKWDADGNPEFVGKVKVSSPSGYEITIFPEDEYGRPSIDIHDDDGNSLLDISLQYGLNGMVPRIFMNDPSNSDVLYFRPDSMVVEQKGNDGYIYQTQIMGGRIIMVKGSEIVWDQNQLPK
nr:MAG TPA: tail protein [Herelleviridae sp.]